MLVLTRQKGQSIIIKNEDGDEIELTILSNRGNQIKIGITAPSKINVYRMEIYRRIQNELLVTE